MQTRQRRETQDACQENSLTIGQVAQLTGVNAKNIRYYESIGLLPGPARSANTYRLYSIADINRLILLHRIRFLGVPLSEAKSLLIGAVDAQCADVQQELLRLVNARLVAITQEITELHRLRDEMEGYQRQLADRHPDRGEAFRTCRDMSCLALSEEAIREASAFASAQVDRSVVAKFSTTDARSAATKMPSCAEGAWCRRMAYSWMPV